MTRRHGTRPALAVACVALLVGCARLGGTPPATPTDGPRTPNADRATVAPSTSATTSTAITVDRDTIRAALLGPSPVPDGWEEEVDEIMAMLEDGLAGLRLPVISGLAADEAACATWRPLVGRQLWATGALLERQVFIAHLAQLAAASPAAIRPDADEALRVSSVAAAEQLAPDGDPAVISQAPREELQRIGLWAVDHCELPVEADDAPDTSDWTDEDIAASCDVDRSLLERAMDEYRAGPGGGRYATHPHALEVTLRAVVYPAWHRIASVDNEASPPTFSVEPIPGAFCDR